MSTSPSPSMSPESTPSQKYWSFRTSFLKRTGGRCSGDWAEQTGVANGQRMAAKRSAPDACGRFRVGMMVTLGCLFARGGARSDTIMVRIRLVDSVETKPILFRRHGPSLCQEGYVCPR